MSKIEVTDCLKVNTNATQDLGDLFKHAKSLPGFVRINFSSAERNASTIHFRSPHHAALALVTRMQDIEEVSFHSVQSLNASEKNPPPLGQVAKPSQVLYVRMMKGMTPDGLKKIVEELPGYLQFLHTKTFGKIYFASQEDAAKAADLLWTETNIYAFFHHMKSDCVDENEESKTVHVQALDRDFAALYMLFTELPGAQRIGYHRSYIFLCFDSHKAARAGVEALHRRTRMKARIVEFEYSPHFTPGSLGTPGTSVRMNFITVSPSQKEVLAVFLTRPGFLGLTYTPKKCWATFDSTQTAAATVEHFNNHTNMKVVFCSNFTMTGCMPQNGEGMRKRKPARKDRAHDRAETEPPAADSATTPDGRRYETFKDTDDGNTLVPYSGFTRILFPLALIAFMAALLVLVASVQRDIKLFVENLAMPKHDFRPIQREIPRKPTAVGG
ncbi:hypothetical protein HDU83_009518 [Entophlyctis luteolus]|nr:hypothetical protein HDU83_009518 [Entophlyctis luteolus]